MTKKGFILAEVLITLGIIGVVAAMTLPILVQNYQKKVWVNQLKKSYSTLNQGFQKMLADNGVTMLSQTDIFQSLNGAQDSYKYCNATNAPDGNECKSFYEYLKKYFKVTNIKKFDNYTDYKINYLYNEKDPDLQPFKYTIIFLADGTFIIKPVFYSQDPTGNTNNIMTGRIGVFFVDLNGLNKPNMLG